MHIQAFRGLRYDLGHVGSLSDVVAPYHDRIDAAQRDQLYEQHPANVVRLILNREEPGDDAHSNRFQRAGRFLTNWRNQGLLTQESDPAVYVHHQTYLNEGSLCTQRSFVCRVQLPPSGEPPAYPVIASNREFRDSQHLLHACRANLSCPVALYSDPDNEAQMVLEQAIVGQTPLEAETLGVTHQLWPVTDVHVIAQFAACMDHRPPLLVHGLGCYQAASCHRDALDLAGDLPSIDAANHVMMAGVSMSDSATLVAPEFAAYSGEFGSIDAPLLAAALAPDFECRLIRPRPISAESVWEALIGAQDPTQIAVYTAQDGHWTIARATEQFELEIERTGVSGRLCGIDAWVVNRLLDDQGTAQKVAQPSIQHLGKLLESDPAGGRRYSLSVLSLPPTMDDLGAMADAGQSRLTGSTQVIPPPISGLILNPLI